MSSSFRTKETDRTNRAECHPNTTKETPSRNLPTSRQGLYDHHNFATFVIQCVMWSVCHPPHICLMYFQ
ncbi:MAG TPA: hypothetical protein DCE42_01165 [Myxococcales bacterium]|nr:hypothetical protein [Deltaproteobacteria bacterium]MBU49127.1 hypothetical protein [Deltaproteobacteria bacterium]HAA53331.1 hypothetical protein [Myxococcales bacterium]